VEKYGRARHATDDNTMRRMRIACWITKATDTHSELILTALQWQQCLRERASRLLLYAHCLSCLFSILFDNIDRLATELRKQLSDQ
jgi:hypothetical protein